MMRSKLERCSRVFVLLALLLTALSAQAGSRLTATGGAGSIEGRAGGGLIPWAVLTGTASDTETGAGVGMSHAWLDDYQLHTLSAAVTINNRLELSAARQILSLDTLGLDTLQLDIFGLKARLWGDLVYSRMGQFSAGVQYKTLEDDALPLALGARHGHGVDAYLSHSRLWLGAAAGYNLLSSVSLRATRANQLGLLGFGGPQNNDYKVVWEGALALMPNAHWALGVEYRQKPDQLDGLPEDDARDIFVAWFPQKHVTATLAWLDMGRIAGLDRQQGMYAALQLAF